MLCAALVTLRAAARSSQSVLSLAHLTCSAPPAPAVTADSSDEEDGVIKGVPRRAPAKDATVPKPSAKPKPVAKPKVSKREVKIGDPLALAEPAPPALTRENATTRFVFVPATTWPDVAEADTAGWIGKIEKVLTNTTRGITTIKFKDGTQHFTFKQACAFKPLT